MSEKRRQKKLAKKYEAGKRIWGLCLFEEHCIIPCVWSGKYDENDNPIVIEYIRDHNDNVTYYECSIFDISMKSVPYYSFNYKAIDWLKNKLDKELAE